MFSQIVTTTVRNVNVTATCITECKRAAERRFYYTFKLVTIHSFKLLFVFNTFTLFRRSIVYSFSAIFFYLHYSIITVCRIQVKGKRVDTGKRANASALIVRDYAESYDICAVWTTFVP